MFWTSSGCIAEAVICIRMITNCLEACSPEHSKSAEALSFSILYRICSQSHENSVLRSIYEKIASLTPSPCLVPLVSPLAPPSKALEAEVNFCVTFVDYSQCGRHLVAGAYKKGVIVLGAETREVIKRLKFHKYPANAVKFTTRSSFLQIAPASTDRSIDIWNGDIRILDINNEQEIGCIDCKQSRHLRGDLAFSADGHLIIYTDWGIDETKIWRTDSQELVFHSNDLSACPQGICMSARLV